MNLQSPAPAMPETGMVDPGMNMNQEDPSMMAGPDIPDGSEMPGQEIDSDGDKKEIQQATGELSQLLNDYKTPDEELDKYVKGMIDSALENRKENDESEEESMENTPEGQDMQPAMPQMESVIFTKGQLRKINEGLNPEEDETDESKPLRKKEKATKIKTPFNAPKFK